MKTFVRNKVAAASSPCAGWTLIEFLVALAVSGLLLTVIATATVNTTRSVYALSNYSQLDQASRQALDTLTRDVRQTKSLSAWSKTNLTGIAVGNSGVNINFSYTYGAAAGTLTRTWNGQSKILLSNCDSLAFAVYQRTPTNNFQFYPTTIPAEAKLVDVNWKCSRKIKGEKANTETIQTAKIVIRN